MTGLEALLTKKINAQKAKGLYRSLSLANIDSIDFTSNDYLGLSRSSELHNAIAERYRLLMPPSNGSTGSRLLSGNNDFIITTESELASIFVCEATLLFNSGYTANLAVLSSLPQRHDTIIYDEYAHACIKDGARLSMARRISFRHNDLNDLESKLKKSSGHIFIAVEAIYSMDGDVCPLRELLDLADRYDASVILDEAHSTGVVGHAGAGLANDLNLAGRVGIRIHTFGKAMGIHGACVAGSQTLQKYLINFARTFIYTTAPDLHSLVAISESFKYLSKHIHLQKDLTDNINYFVDQMGQTNSLTPSSSAIQGFIIPGNNQVRESALTLQKNNLDVRPILSPTVPAGLERLRICLHTYNSKEEIQFLTSQLKSMTHEGVAI